MDSKRRKGRIDDSVLNVSPDADPSDLPGPPRNIGDTQAFRSGKAGFSRAWGNYRTHLATSFKRMSRYQQEALISRMCLIITVGVTGLALLLFYPLINRTVRVFLVPGAICGAWWAANRIVTPAVLSRLESILNTDDIDQL
jgi:hypothetical protein